jgi:hypothetical protein
MKNPPEIFRALFVDRPGRREAAGGHLVRSSQPLPRNEEPRSRCCVGRKPGLQNQEAARLN